MAIAKVESFDGFAFASKWSGFVNGISSSGPVPNQGQYATFDWNGGNMQAQLPAAVEHATMGIAMFFKRTSGDLMTGSFRSDSGATEHIRYEFSCSTGNIRVGRGAMATVLGTASGALVSGWNHVEIIVTLHDTTGVVEVWVNDVQVLNLTGQDTKNGGTKTVFDYVVPVLAANNSNSVGVDSVVVWTGADLGDGNTTRLGPHSVTRQAVTADDTPLNWTPSTGTDHYALVDETTANDSDYVASSTPGDVDSFVFADISTDLNVKAVAVNVRGLLSEAGSHAIRSRIRSGTTVENGATHTLTLSGTGRQDIFEADPDTGVAWTPAGVNGAEVQVELVS